MVIDRYCSTLTQQRLKEICGYDPETGSFRWIDRSRKGTASGFRGKYLAARINNRSYYLHRLAWLYMRGEWPATEIDHINGDATDNRFANLREATRRENSHNQARKRSNTSGVKGVCWDKSRSIWQVHIRIDGKKKILGRFASKEEAAAAYARAAVIYHGKFARAA